MNPRRAIFLTRFKIDPSGCHLWLGAKSGLMGYGTFALDGKKSTAAHRAAYLLFVGPIPDGLCVLHRCDVPACVKPEHLFLGTRAENMQDMAQKSRSRFNEAHHLTTVPSETVAKIKTEYATGNFTQKELARKFQVHQSSVSRFVRGVSRRRTEGPTLKRRKKAL